MLRLKLDPYEYWPYDITTAFCLLLHSLCDDSNLIDSIFILYNVSLDKWKTWWWSEAFSPKRRETKNNGIDEKKNKNIDVVFAPNFDLQNDLTFSSCTLFLILEKRMAISLWWQVLKSIKICFICLNAELDKLSLSFLIIGKAWTFAICKHMFEKGIPTLSVG